jgi:hypothetical protein
MGASCSANFLSPKSLMTGGLGYGADYAYSKSSACDRSKRAMIDVTNEIISRSLVQSITDCTFSGAARQRVSVSCHPELRSLGSSTETPGVYNWSIDPEVYEGNASCGQCVDGVISGMLAHHELERRVWDERNGEVRVRLGINDELVLMSRRLELCGAGMCKACVLRDVNQYTAIDTTGDNLCKSSATVSKSFRVNVEAALRSQLEQNQDVLSSVASMFGLDTKLDIVNELTSRITSEDITRIVNASMLAIRSSQSLTFSSSGGSMLRGVGQTSALAATMRVVVDSNISTKIMSDAEWNVLAQMVREQSTLSSVGDLLFESVTAVVSMVDTIIGQVLIAALVLLGVVVIGLLGYVFYTRGWKKENETPN